MTHLLKLPRIAFIACGGTIGGEWSPSQDTVVPSKMGNKRLFEYMNEAVHLHRKMEYVDLFNKDSRQVTTADRLKLVKKILQLRKRGFRHFLVTHGTFTLQKTALFLQEKLKKQDLHIVLTGSMVPNSGFAPSDASFNMGFAIAKLTSQEVSAQPGVWIAMNGLLGRPALIIKNVRQARFEPEKGMK